MWARQMIAVSRWACWRGHGVSPWFQDHISLGPNAWKLRRNAMRRRDFLKRIGGAAGCAILQHSLVASAPLLPRAQAAPALPLDRLLTGLSKADADVHVRDSGAAYDRLLRFYNR